MFEQGGMRMAEGIMIFAIGVAYLAALAWMVLR